MRGEGREQCEIELSTVQSMKEQCVSDRIELVVGARRSELVRIDNEATQRMVENIRFAEKRLSQLNKECPPYCSCSTCLQNKYTRRVSLSNLKEVLWKGYLLLHPNTPHYQMVSSTLTYQRLWDITINFDLLKVKYFMDGELKLPMIKVSHVRQGRQSETKLLANRRETLLLYVKTVAAYLSVNYRYWVEVREEGVEGWVYKKYAVGGSWEKVWLKAEKNAIKNEKGETVTVSSSCLWTSFQMREWESPHLLVKLWEGIWKVSYAFPIEKLPQWLHAFLLAINYN